jgi:sRNA-binding protein
MSEVIERPRAILTLHGVIPRPAAMADARTMGGCPPVTEPPSLSEPATKAARRAAQLAEAKALLGVLVETWPALFANSEVRPMAIGIHHQILAARPEIDPAVLSLALRLHTRRSVYQNALLEAGHPRFDLAGNPAGAVTEAEIERLQQHRIAASEKQQRRFASQPKCAPGRLTRA